MGEESHNGIESERFHAKYIEKKYEGEYARYMISIISII